MLEDNADVDDDMMATEGSSRQRALKAVPTHMPNNFEVSTVRNKIVSLINMIIIIIIIIIIVMTMGIMAATMMMMTIMMVMITIIIIIVMMMVMITVMAETKIAVTMKVAVQ